MKYTDVKCKNCNKVIGKLDVDGKTIFKTLKEGVTEYNGLFCNNKCIEEYEWEFVSKRFFNWINCWANFDNHKKCINKDKLITDFGNGYRQAISDIYRKIKPSSKKTTTEGKKNE